MKKITATLITNQITSNDSEAHNLHKKSGFGTKSNQKILYSKTEALYLVEKNKLEVQDFRSKKLSKKTLLKKFSRANKNFQQKYTVFKDLTKSGYLVKTGLKFGSDFRIYKKTQKHSLWICYVISESQKISPQDFAAKNRVAHSSKKNLLLAVVDNENSPTYYEISWTKP